MVVLSFNDVKLEVECIINDRSRELNCMNFGVVTVGIKADRFETLGKSTLGYNLREER